MENQQKALFNMIHQQIKPYDVSDHEVIRVMSEIPRQNFVPEAFQSVAFADMAIPIKEGHEMLHPKIIARALQALNISTNDNVLEIGTGTGYTTALLSNLASHIYSVEIDKHLYTMAEQNLRDGYANVTLANQDGALGWEQHGPYSVIFVGGSYPVELPALLIEQLAMGGRCFAIIGKGPAMKACLFTKTSQGLTTTTLFETQTPALINAPESTNFIF